MPASMSPFGRLAARERDFEKDSLIRWKKGTSQIIKFFLSFSFCHDGAVMVEEKKVRSCIVT